MADFEGLMPAYQKKVLEEADFGGLMPAYLHKKVLGEQVLVIESAIGERLVQCKTCGFLLCSLEGCSLEGFEKRLWRRHMGNNRHKRAPRRQLERLRQQWCREVPIPHVDPMATTTRSLAACRF